MSNRMSVLSRRLRSFAIFFSFVTIASFLVGAILTSDSGMTFTSNAARNDARLFFAGVGSLCFIAALFLWMARGFAWAMVPEKPAEEKRFVQARATVPEKPAEEKRSVQAVAAEKAAEEYEPIQEFKPVQENVRDWKPAEETPVASERPVAEYKPQEYRAIQIEDYKPIQEYKPPPPEYKPIQYAEKKSVEEKAVAPEKPATEKKRAKWWKKPEEEKVEYTITGRRIE